MTKRKLIISLIVVITLFTPVNYFISAADNTKEETDATDVMLSFGLDKQQLTEFLEHSILKEGCLTLNNIPFSLSPDVRELLEERRSFLEELNMQVESVEFSLDEIKAREFGEGSIWLEAKTTELVQYQDLDEPSVSKPEYHLVFDTQDEELTLVNIYSLEPTFMQFIRQGMVEKVKAAEGSTLPFLFTDLYENNALLTEGEQKVMELNPVGNLSIRLEFPADADIDRILAQKMTITLNLAE